MFDRIAKRYDMVNRIISLGVDRAWRKRTVAALDLRSGESVLDIATGTADLAIEVAARTGATVTGLDPSLGMLQIGQRKVSDHKIMLGAVGHGGVSGEESG